MDFFSVISLFGGLAFFLFGMTTMSNGLEKLSGGKLEGLLEKLTNSPIKGVALGAVVTALIQSSSAVTVMLVGFVNSGIMRLSQAIGVIMGANIGTTATAWIISLTGLSGTNVFMRMLQPKNFTLIFAVVGAVLFMFFRSGKKTDIGQILLGFAVLIFGMEMMSGAVSPLKDNPDFANILVIFKNPILGVALGAVVTAIIQSSSASVGILQALSSTGVIMYSTAIPIILGQNIGTCVTALLSCINANKSAKRTAIVHLYFNVIGTVIFLILLYILKFAVGGIFPFWNDPANKAGIAIVHSVFNIFCTLIFLPFTKFLEKLAYLTIRDKGDEQLINPADEQLLDERFLSSPSFAISQCRNAVVNLSEYVKENFISAVGLIWSFDEKKQAAIIERENKIDLLNDKIIDYLIRLTNSETSDKESKHITQLLHTSNDLERIADHAENILEVAAELHKLHISFSDVASEELRHNIDAVEEILNTALRVFKSEDKGAAMNVEPLEDVIDLLKDKYKANHVERLKKGLCSVESGVAFNDLLMNFERIADHCSNIAVYLMELDNDSFNPHIYLANVYTLDSNEYREKFDYYKEKYYTAK